MKDEVRKKNHTLVPISDSLWIFDFDVSGQPLQTFLSHPSQAFDKLHLEDEL